MRHALNLALLGTGAVSPNPRVGCVIVRDSEIVAKGWHHRYGDVHAEVDALRSFSGDPQHATMYVTLEPCCHTDKQPPCVDAIVASGIKRVVVGMIDPYSRVSGRGIASLRARGIEVIVGVLQEECGWANRWFSHHVTSGLSYVAVKIATSIDMAIAAPSTVGRWITSEASRAATHALRNELDAVMIGIGTAVADNPLLTVRDVAGRNPMRIIVDPHCDLPIESHLVQTANNVRTIIFCDESSLHGTRAEDLRAKSIEVLSAQTAAEGLDPLSIIRTTGKMGIASILLEGGPRLVSSFFRAHCVHELNIHMAPVVYATGARWFNSHSHTDSLALHSCDVVGPDIHLVYTVGST